MDVARYAPQVRSLPCGRYLLVPLTENKEGSKELMVLRGGLAPTRFPINILYSPMDRRLYGLFVINLILLCSNPGLG